MDATDDVKVKGRGHDEAVCPSCTRPACSSRRLQLVVTVKRKRADWNAARSQHFILNLDCGEYVVIDHRQET